MNIGILSKRTVKLTEKIKKYLESKGHTITIYTSNILDISDKLLKHDFFILKSKTLLFLYAGCYLKANGIHVIPDSNLCYKQRNKREAHFLIEKAGLKAPKFYMGTKSTLIKNLKKEDYPCILKPLTGSGGIGIKVINTSRDFNSDDDDMLYVEEFIEGTHLNVSFIGDEICCCEKPPLCPNSKRMDEIPLSKDISETVSKWQSSYNILFGHLDIVREKATNILYIVDVGPFPQFLNWINNENPAPKICDLILTRFKELNSIK